MPTPWARTNVNDHMRDDVGSALLMTATCSSDDINILTAVERLDTRLRDGMMEVLDDTGAVFVSRHGSYFGLSQNVVISQTRTLKKWKLPGTDVISIKQWAGGHHFYAKVDGEEVVIDGITKFDSESHARQAAEEFIRRKNHGIRIR